MFGKKPGDKDKMPNGDKPKRGNTVCPQCNGTGKGTLGFECMKCKGEGQIKPWPF